MLSGFGVASDFCQRAVCRRAAAAAGSVGREESLQSRAAKDVLRVARANLLCR
jgi:hypothetical protein